MERPVAEPTAQILRFHVDTQWIRTAIAMAACRENQSRVEDESMSWVADCSNVGATGQVLVKGDLVATGTQMSCRRDIGTPDEAAIEVHDRVQLVATHVEVE